MLDLRASTPKAFVDGTHRTRAPEQTLSDYRRFMPMMGITRLANITGLDRIGLPVFLSIRPNSRLLATAQGKGETVAAAKASALMESIEGWHVERIHAPLLVDSWECLRKHARCVDASRMPVRRDSRFGPMSPINWIEGFDIARGEPVWVPFEAVSVNFVRHSGHSPVFVQSTNGLASGNHRSEAVLHALCEVIERDASCLWEYLPEERRAPGRVRLDTARSETLRAALSVLDAKGVVVAAWDITSDIGIPSYYAVVVDDPDAAEWRPVPMCSGAGTHPDPDIALSRAVHEAIQSRATVISGSRDDVFPGDYVRSGHRSDHARAVAEIRAQPASVNIGDRKLPVADDFEGDLRMIVDRLRAAGLDSVVVVDLTRDDVGIPVVKVVVPGLEPPRQPLYRPGARAERYRDRVAS
jgi:ribosomal protein S12 methylthiotransferase accessory factor